ncbi:pilus assembly protein [Serratia sp. 3ACOL1]|uniref:TadE/TadG family type IV pilus assembly protein n=1 Tax=Serratia sp. 3ACOL1 TaxID=2448483 RepID=UPI000EF4B2D7|nr:TadE family protein [Serratia sp. 3ACOL1]AYM91957.1 pilus assembly protein [Serratia sp. 3ACOL1]
MKKLISVFFKNNRGVASIEFSLTVILFIFMVMFVAEIARMAYISSVLDLAISEGAKDAKNYSSASGNDYQTRFRQRMTEQGGTLWGFLAEKDMLAINVSYASSIAEMIYSGGGVSGRNKPLARYFVRYRYQPIFFPVPDVWKESTFIREVIFVQEYERSEFMD